MPDKNQQTHNCIWCSSPIEATYKGKLFCNKSYCHTAFHYHRTKYHSPLTPKEFKDFILKALENEDHPNPNHPIHTLKKKIVDIKNNAINLKEIIIRKTENSPNAGH